MRKFRGKKRYFKGLLDNNLDDYFDRLDYHAWFDYWHDHPDWYGLGNISWKHRKPHLEALLRRFNYLKTKLQSRTEDFQIFCIIDIDDPSQDSIYIHTKNPNEDNFPMKADKYNGDIQILSQLKDFIETSGNDWFYHKWDRENETVNLIYLYDKSVGLSII